MSTIEGQIVNINKTSRGRIEIGNDGLIAKIGIATGRADLVLKDELIFPGFIDLHVHARECADHSQDYKEDFTSAGQAAINGGVVAFADMPNNPVPPVDEKSYAEKLALTKKSAVDVLLYAIITAYSKPLPFPVPYKAFTSKSVGETFFSQLADLEEGVKKYQGQNVSFHCEDPEIIRQNQNQPSHEQRRPEQAEIKAVEFVLGLIEKYGIKGKICHCSTAEGLQKILAAKHRGLEVTVEVTPHHLYFDETMLTHENRKMFQVNPPIRQTKENRLALITALKNGDIDYLATDHAPHSIAEKEKAMSGLTHLDTYGPFTVWLMSEHKFTAQDIARVCAYNPGQFLNQFQDKKYGEIKEGFAGSLSIIDMNRPIKIEKSKLKTKASWSPFEGVSFRGSVPYTIIRGKFYQNAI
jgi:dihydroorotase